ncbi:hypothetical protein PENDEC_c007G06971 [Penicillium decumbens]|uniref:XTP/dITP diphosphatase n=1 Tax=Penicillium decumbens TaxID=69771 RepID=A0A1V6PF99_PENDC|nr:hypothetical protein PENDEC_c007G06971 [Penicillium decumbens]
MAPTKINFITGNKDKVAQVRSIFGSVIELENRAVDIPEIQGTIEEIAKEKARRAAEAINGPALIEDSALEFHALKGLPGPYIKSFFDALGLEGLNKMLDGFEDRTAEAGNDYYDVKLNTIVQGTIVRPRGIRDFGWGAIFEYDGRATFAEMEVEEKNRVSPGYKALAKSQQWLTEGQQQ